MSTPDTKLTPSGFDFMIDLETMGTGPDAAIVAIGAVEMDLEHFEIGRTFYRTIDLKSAVQHGGVMDTDTVLWWLRQSDQARQALTGNTTMLHTVLDDFNGWLGYLTHRGYNDLRIWGNGSDFDNVILARTYHRSGTMRPWIYPNNRCYRTLKALYPDVKMERTGVAHNALDDAMSQARHLLQIMRQVRQTR